MAKIRYHNIDGEIRVTYDNQRIGTIVFSTSKELGCRYNGKYDAIINPIIGKQYKSLHNVSMLEAMKYYDQFNWRSIVEVVGSFIPTQQWEPPKGRQVHKNRWSHV